MKKIFYLASIVVIITAGCKERYTPAFISPVTGYLVVEGYINSGNGSTSIQLTRTTKLKDTVQKLYEHNAHITVESDNAESFPLLEEPDNVYRSASLVLNKDQKYRVHIQTADGKEYQSDFARVKHTPPIDSISWQKENGGVRIYVNTHDDQTQPGYYRWTYSETWEFHSAYLSFLDWYRDPVTNEVFKVTERIDPDRIYRCWKTQPSYSILLGSSEKLSANNIVLPVRYIKPMAEELSVRYYMELTQYNHDKDAYLFYQKLSKNTAQLGSVFDAQPSELTGNIHCVTNPAEPVIGYMEVTEEKKAKIFITNEQVTPWAPPVNCSKVIVRNLPDSIKPFVDGYLPLMGVTYRGQEIVTFSAAPVECVDCTLRGTNVRPPFW